jgi:hypothetical protein
MQGVVQPRVIAALVPGTGSAHPVRRVDQRGCKIDGKFVESCAHYFAVTGRDAMAWRLLVTTVRRESLALTPSRTR